MSNLQLFNQTMTAQKTQSYLSQVLGDKKNAFVANVTSLVANDKKLQECEPVTLMYAAINATTLDLPLNKNLGYAYVVPYRNGRENKTEAQFQIGYKGLVQLAIRSGEFQKINVTEVKDGEIKDFDLLTGDITFKAAENRMSLATVGYVAYFQLTNGFSKMLYMTREEVEAHGKKYSKAFGQLWTTDFDAMAKKTVLKLLLMRFAPLSIEKLRQAVETDQAVIRTEEMTPDYVDNATEETTADDVTPQSIIKAILKAKTLEEVQEIEDSIPSEFAAIPEVVEAITKKRESMQG